MTQTIPEIQHLQVHKYGGTSMGSVSRIQASAKIVADAVAQGHAVVVIVSAMAGETDRLIGLLNELGSDTGHIDREYSALLATGEMASAALMAAALRSLGIEALSLNAWQANIKSAEQYYTSATIDDIDTKVLAGCLRKGMVPVVTGFQGVNNRSELVTLGRGGSDTTAVALACALNAKECRIYTDVDGVYTADPRIEPNAQRIHAITHEEMVELAGAGSKVLHVRSVDLARKYELPIRVLSSFSPDSGTLVTLDMYDAEVNANSNGNRPQNEDSDMSTSSNTSGNTSGMEAHQVSGIAHDAKIAQVILRGVADTQGIAASVLGPVAESGVIVDMIVQNKAAQGKTDIAFTVSSDQLPQTITTVRQTIAANNWDCAFEHDDVSKVSVVGTGMRTAHGVAAQTFQIMANAKINIQMISTSEIKIAMLVSREDTAAAVHALHKGFGLDIPSTK